MLVTVLLCLASMTALCLCARGLIAVTTVSFLKHGFAMAGSNYMARRMARGYLVFALGVMTLASLYATCTWFIKLFTDAV